MANEVFEKFLVIAGKVPGVRIERDEYLQKTFKRAVSQETLNRIVLEGPVAVGIPMEQISELADQAIKTEAMQAVSVSAGLGVFSGPSAVAAIPADVAQFYGHVFIVMQKLLYLYGWEENIFDESGNLDDVTSSMVMLYMGVMFGVTAANQVLSQLAKTVAKNTMNRAVRQAVFQMPKWAIQKVLTKVLGKQVGSKGTNAVLLKIAQKIGVKSTIKVVGNSGPKLVPVVGVGVSAAFTAAWFTPMAKRLKKQLEREIINSKDKKDEEE